MRDARRVEEPVIEGGASNFSRAQVPWAFDLAAAWSWRILVVAAAVLGTLWVLSFFAVVVLPLLVALFASALLTPVVHWLVRIGAGRRIASLIVVIFSIAAVGLLLTFVGQQIANGMDDLSKQVVDGVQQVRDWLRTGPLRLSDQDLQNTLKDLQDSIGGNSGSGILSRATEVGATVGHIVAGFFIVLFGTYFFLADGPLIWTWFVRLFPRAARLRVDSSGRVGWRSLTQFVRATVLVAATDAIGIMIGAAILGVPVRAGNRRPGLPRCVRADDRRVRVRHRRRPGRAGRGGPVQGAADAGRDHRGPADRGARPAAVPDGPVRVRPPAGRDRGDRARRDRRRASRAP